MRYVTDREDGVTDYNAYFAYVHSVRESMPTNLFAFASKHEHYDLNSHDSLHDAWLEYLTVRESSGGGRSENRAIEIESCYLGPFHDRRFFLTYRGVSRFSLKTPAESTSPNQVVRHGDLLAHEVRVTDRGTFEHEIEFSRGGVFLIEFGEFEHRIEPYAYAK